MNARRRIQLVVGDEDKARMEALAQRYGGSMSSAVRRGLRLLEVFMDAKDRGYPVVVVPHGVAVPQGVIPVKETP